MGNFFLGWVGIGLLGWSGVTREDAIRPSIFRGPFGHVLGWIAAAVGIYLIYRGWLRPWL